MEPRFMLWNFLKIILWWKTRCNKKLGWATDGGSSGLPDRDILWQCNTAPCDLHDVLSVTLMLIGLPIDKFNIRIIIYELLIISSPGFRRQAYVMPLLLSLLFFLSLVRQAYVMLLLLSFFFFLTIAWTKGISETTVPPSPNFPGW